jgi:SHS2 domain-containing protein
MYSWVEHTAELELAIRGPTKEEVFAEALHAFAELVGHDAGGAPAEHAVSITASDAPALLAEWLGELIYLAETQDFVPDGVFALELDEQELNARIIGRIDEPSHLVKSVTYHDLELKNEGQGWIARVVLDV